MKINIRQLYLYLASFIGLVVIVFGSVSLVDLGLKTYVFTEAERYYYTQPVILEGNQTEEVRTDEDKNLVARRHMQAANAVAMLLVGFPLYLYHWRILQKEA